MQETKNGNLISEAKLPSDTIKSYDVILRARIADWRARMAVAEMKLEQCLHLKEMLFYHSEMHRCSEKLHFYETFYNGEWGRGRLPVTVSKLYNAVTT